MVNEGHRPGRWHGPAGWRTWGGRTSQRRGLILPELFGWRCILGLRRPAGNSPVPEGRAGWRGSADNWARRRALPPTRTCRQLRGRDGRKIKACRVCGGFRRGAHGRDDRRWRWLPTRGGAAVRPLTWPARHHIGVQPRERAGPRCPGTNLRPRLRRHNGLAPCGVRLRVLRCDSATPGSCTAAATLEGVGQCGRRDSSRAGAAILPRRSPCHWSRSYFAVEDTDAGRPSPLCERPGESTVRPAWDQSLRPDAVVADDHGGGLLR